MVVFLAILLNFTVDTRLHLNLPRVYPLLLNIVLVQIPIARASLFLSTFLIHLHNLLAKICSAAFFIRRVEPGIGFL